MDIHVFPQVSFLAPFAQFDFIGEMEDMNATWAALGDVASEGYPERRGSWPPYNAQSTWQARGSHTATDRNSGNTDRHAMSRLLPRNCATPESLAVHRMLLPDFVCLGYTMSDECAAQLGDHRVKCPLGDLRANAHRLRRGDG